jgi:hypothetical protein
MSRLVAWVDNSTSKHIYCEHGSFEMCLLGHQSIHYITRSNLGVLVAYNLSDWSSELSVKDELSW